MESRLRISNRTRGIAIALCLYFGGFGAHKYYTNKAGIGVLYSMFCWTFIPSIISCIDLIVLLCTSDKNFDSKVNYIRI